MDMNFTEEQNMLRDSVRKLMDKHAPVEKIRQWDKERVYPYELYDAWVDAGLLRMPFPEAYGGLGGNVIDMAIINEELAYRSADLSMCYGGNIFCGLNLVHKATEEQKKHWLPQLLDGKIRFSISMSEPDAGSDIGAMRTTARREGNDYIINGQKLWATSAGVKNNVINVYVKTDTKAHYRQGMSLFLVENDRPGVKFRKLDMLGRRSAGTYEVFFDDVRVPADRLVGGENKGWDVVLAGLQVERVVSAAGSVGAAAAIVDLAIQFAKDRKQFGKAIGQNQAIAHMLADMSTEVEAARTLMWRAAALVAEGKPALREISMAKLYASEVYVKVAQQGMQVMGGYGYNAEFDMERFFRDSRAATIAAGTSQIQKNVIANLMGFKVT
jgi:alkylation response protein AidB-like acyl-CoA dehydrogenase